MARLLGYAQPLLRGKVRGLFLKGRDVEAEMADLEVAAFFVQYVHKAT